MVVVEENVLVKNMTTFKMNARVRYFCAVRSVTDLRDALVFTRSKKIDFMILGGGSNTIFTDAEILDICLIKMDIQGFLIEDIPNNLLSVRVTVGAGVDWDDTVAETVRCGLAGLEALSAIPGSTGATPVQNVGAYGVEVKDVIESVLLLDTETFETKRLTNKDCQFGYRDSLFKHNEGKKYIILSVTFILSKSNSVVTPNYPGVNEYFEKHRIKNPTLLDIRNAITQIRWSKLPDPRILASCGSFFKNPIVRSNIADALKQKYPHAVMYDLKNGLVKISAGWMIDTLGFKGQQFGNLLVYDKNALVIANKGNATMSELMNLMAKIQTKVKDEFGVVIEPEPVFISSGNSKERVL
jgi:UDP-N-acetylmuramate dehydrogenase